MTGGNGVSGVCLPGRSPAELLAVIEGLRVETNPRFMAGQGLTFCNRFITDVTSALGCEIPYMLANSQNEWLRGPLGNAAGWTSATADEAWAAAQSGCPAVASWKNNQGPHGHIALVTVTPADNGSAIYIAQAGRENFSCRPIAVGFGLKIKPEFYVHS